MTDTPLIDLAMWREDLEVLRQNWLLSESAFLTFATELGLSVHGVLQGEPSDFHRNKWLECDEKDSVGRPWFHRFRIYPFYKLLERKALTSLPTNDTHPSQISVFEKSVRDWNEIANLAILLEPVYWPSMVGNERRSSEVSEAQYRARADDYRKKILDVVKGLNAEIWRRAHGQLRVEAAWMDKNAELYALLRLSHWKIRENLTGKIAGALWIRHMAELIRCSFEEVLNEKWPQEYEGFGLWHPQARRRTFGSERPFDDPFRSKPYLARTFGLFTGSAVRWYVEGDTEYYAIHQILGEPSGVGIDFRIFEEAFDQGGTTAPLGWKTD